MRMVGPVLTAGITYVCPIPMLLVIAALWFAACVMCIFRLDRWATHDPCPGIGYSGQSLGGSMWAGIRLASASPYLLGICAYLFLLTMSATVLYLDQTAPISREIASPESGARLFAGIDLTVNVLTFVTQVWVTNRLVLRFGLAAALLFLPIVSAMGFLALGMTQALEAYLLFTVVRRVGEYAISKPAREVLFTVVSREEKYEAKNFIDTAVSRGGDASTGWAVSGVKALGVTAAQLAWLLVPAMFLWGWIGWFLARREASLQHPQQPVS